MIRVAAGEKLTIGQDDVTLNGWAIEARVYAEDPFRNFLPSTGRLTNYRPPAADPHVRVDTGVFEGGEISMYYDPMIAKLCTWGSTRDAAIGGMRRGAGPVLHPRRQPQHPVPGLADGEPALRRRRLTTNFIAEEYPNGFHASDLPPEDPAVLVAVAAVIHRSLNDRDIQISGKMAGSKAAVRDDWVVVVDGTAHPVHLHAAAGSPQRIGYTVDIAGRHHTVWSDWQIGEPLFRGTVDGSHVCVQIDRVGIGYRLHHSGSQAIVKVLTPKAAALDALMPVKAPPDMSKFLLSPMPGLLVSLAVSEGQEIKAGEVLAVVEAMKMENILRASQDGTVAKIHAAPGSSLAVDQKIVEFA